MIMTTDDSNNSSSQTSTPLPPAPPFIWGHNQFQITLISRRSVGGMSSVEAELYGEADRTAATVAGNLKRQEKMMTITASDFVASQHVAIDLVVVTPAG